MRPSFLLPMLLGFAGCERSSPPPPAALPASAYEVRGVIQKLKPETGGVVIAHEPIAGYMEAMTMEFTASDPRELAKFAPGDVVTFRLTVAEERSRIDRLRKTGTAPVVPHTESATPAPGTPLPDCAFIDSRGTPLRLSDFKGRALALTFFFTRCPLPDFCPRMNSHFSEVQRALSADPATHWHLLSLTLDPDYDTPARLAEYAAPYQPDSAHWTFATGARADIEKLGASFGLQIARPGALPDHNLRTIVIDPAGSVQRVFHGNEWKPADLTTELRRAMQN